MGAIHNASPWCFNKKTLNKVLHVLKISNLKFVVKIIHAKIKKMKDKISFSQLPKMKLCFSSPFTGKDVHTVVYKLQLNFRSLG